MKIVPIGTTGIHITRDIFKGLTSLDAVDAELLRIRKDDTVLGERKSKDEVVVDANEYLDYLNNKKIQFEKKSTNVLTKSVKTAKSVAINTTKSESVKQLNAKIAEQNSIIKELLAKIEHLPKYYEFKDTDDVRNLLDEVFDSLNPTDDGQLQEDLMLTAIVRGVFGDAVAKNTMGDAYKTFVSHLK